MYNKAITNIKPLGFMWDTRDPFLFCVHHLDAYPAANDNMSPAAGLQGRNIGQDFTLKDGWRMYHGDTIPGFPAHPHRGFETITVVLEGLVDHSDSHGAAGRYGNGDVQWMTAGAGLQHSEMFPLLNREAGNPLELFQIWINLPAAKKFVQPHYAMLWAENIPVYHVKDATNRVVEIRIIAGKIGDITALPPAPDSWATNSQNEVAIWVIKMEDHARWTIPAASPEVNRTLYFCKGTSIHIAGVEVPSSQAIDLLAEQAVALENGPGESHFLLLQGRPINEPVVKHGPFVMNTHNEIQQAIRDYQRDQFGGWPWPRYDMVHGGKRGRFAKYRNGDEEVR
jgi:redox-sensitive bicupin YhaK (pirin superfamily)